MTRVVTLVGYAVVAASAVAVEVAARRGRPVATFGGAVSRLLHHWPLRVLGQAAWLWLGWHLFVR